MAAWERFLTGEPLVPTAVSKIVLSSWERSSRSCVEPRLRSAPIAASADSLEQLRRRNQDLMWAAQGLFVASAHLLGHSGAIMLLTDPNGVIIDVAGDMHTRDAAHDIRLVEGANWRESVMGTNGIGTSLAMRHPVQVHAAEHFCEGIKRWTCAAAPIYWPGTEEIVGVVDISGPPSTYQRSNLVLALAAAREIESALTMRASSEHIQLLEASLKFSAIGDAVAIMALDRSAKLIHISGSLPGTEWSLGTRIPGVERGLQVDEWARRLPESLRPEWLHPVRVDGSAIGALLVVPRRPISMTGPQPAFGSASRPVGGSEIDLSHSGFDKLIGDSPALRTAIDRARHLSGRRVGVLIQGETGVGKELFASAIHGDEERNGPFVCFNCGATTKELIGSELFGHVRGAYTGATNEGRAGRFELAHGGTLCLDEIGELPLELQPVLLRALEEGVIYRLGDSKPRRVNVRLLAMTNRNLLEEVEAGRFRRDLYHRIGVTQIHIPPLRDRGNDLDILTENFNRSLAARHGVATRQFSTEVMALMHAYRWPGNVRELRNVVEGLLLTSDDPCVQCSELPPELLEEARLPPFADYPTTVMHATGAASLAVPTVDGDSLEVTERSCIARTIRACYGNLTKAARVLGISRSTLYRKVERYHLQAIVSTTHDG